MADSPGVIAAAAAPGVIAAAAAPAVGGGARSYEDVIGCRPEETG